MDLDMKIITLLIVLPSMHMKANSHTLYSPPLPEAKQLALQLNVCSRCLCECRCWIVLMAGVNSDQVTSVLSRHGVLPQQPPYGWLVKAKQSQTLTSSDIYS